jgi:hypothetical protein
VRSRGVLLIQGPMVALIRRILVTRWWRSRIRNRSPPVLGVVVLSLSWILTGVRLLLPLGIIIADRVGRLAVW